MCDAYSFIHFLIKCVKLAFSIVLCKNQYLKNNYSNMFDQYICGILFFVLSSSVTIRFTMDDILMPSEVEFYIETMKPKNLTDIGSKEWLEWHQRLQKLNQQALVEAASVKEEHVKETLISFRKIHVLVHEAIVINIWKHRVLPELLKLEPNPEKTFIVYTILFHEGISVALLELAMYHASCAETLDDSALDLLDYICGTISQLLVVKNEEPNATDVGVEQLEKQKDNLAFDIGIRSLSIMRYLAEYLQSLPLTITNQVYNAYDVPVLLVEILLYKPWHKDGKVYSGGHWMELQDEALGQAEAQVWLALHQLILNPSCATHYKLTNSRRSQLMKIQPLITPILLDQLSPLIDLKQWLCQVAVSDTQNVQQNPLLLEPILEIKQRIFLEGDGKWKKIAKKQLPSIFISNQKDLMEIASCLSEAYNTNLIEKFETKQNNQCSQCGKNAIQRCSRCKKQWYCSRNCQVTHWPQHKEECK